MRRKDILIISVVLIIITFGTVFSIYYGINGDNIFSKVKEEIVELAENKGAYHSNGWETAIVDKIKYDIPIPVGFSYVEGNKEKGLIIKDNETDEKYMWIPYQENLAGEEYEKIILNKSLEDNSSESIQSIQKYGGFFAAIDERSDEERFEEYLKENAKDFKQYKELKELGYEGYKEEYKEQTGEEFDLNSFENIVVDDITKLDNELKTSVHETHTATKDELMSIVSYNNKIGNKIKLNNLKTLTLLGSRYVDTEGITREKVLKKIETAIDKIEEAIEYIAEEKNIKESKIEKSINKETDDKYKSLKDIEEQLPEKITEEKLEEFDEITEEIYEEIREELLNSWADSDKLYREVERIIDIDLEEEVEDDEQDEKIELEENDEKIYYAIKYIAKVNGETEEEVKEKVGYSSEIDYNSKEKAYNEIREQLIDEVEDDYEKWSTVVRIFNDRYIDKDDLEDIEYDDNENNLEKEWSKKLINKVVNNIPVPAGFDVEEDSTVTTLKIKNTDNLSFIWIPVENIDEIKEEFINNAKQANLNDLTISLYEECTDDTETIEYQNLKDSIEMYGGFYVSESELGYDKNGNVINKFRNMVKTQRAGTGYDYVSNGDYYRNVTEGNIERDLEGKLTVLGEKQSSFELTYENAVNVCKDLFADSETVVSHLTYGIEYDAIVNYLIDTNIINVTKAFKESSEIGKYKETETIKSAWEKELYLNGIYGLAGNLEEITQEKDGENIVLRGGSWNTFGTTALAIKNPIEESNMDKQDNQKIGSVGFRACLYIKTEYEENEELDAKKERAKEEIREYINGLSVEIGGFNYFNNKYNAQTKEYENPALNHIVKYVNERIDKETSSALFNKIIQYGKDEVEKLVMNITAILEYPEGFVYGDLNDECWEIKEKAIQEMQTLSWNKGILTAKDGTETSYAEIRQNAEKNVDEKISAYIEQKIIDYIDNYPTAPDKTYTATIKERAKEEMRYSKDLTKLQETAVKYQGIIEVAHSFDNYNPEYVEYANDRKAQYLDKIANEAKTKEEADNLKTEAINEINSIMENKKANYEILKDKVRNTLGANNELIRNSNGEQIQDGMYEFVHVEYNGKKCMYMMYGGKAWVALDNNKFIMRHNIEEGDGFLTFEAAKDKITEKFEDSALKTFKEGNWSLRLPTYDEYNEQYKLNGNSYYTRGDTLDDTSDDSPVYACGGSHWYWRNDGNVVDFKGEEEINYDMICAKAILEYNN